MFYQIDNLGPEKQSCSIKMINAARQRAPGAERDMASWSGMYRGSIVVQIIQILRGHVGW